MVHHRTVKNRSIGRMIGEDFALYRGEIQSLGSCFDMTEKRQAILTRYRNEPATSTS